MRKSGKDDIEFEIEFYESVLKGAPNFAQALSVLGDLYTRAGFWQKGLDVDVQLSKLRPHDHLTSAPGQNLRNLRIKIENLGASFQMMFYT